MQLDRSERFKLPLRVKVWVGGLSVCVWAPSFCDGYKYGNKSWSDENSKVPCSIFLITPPQVFMHLYIGWKSFSMLPPPPPKKRKKVDEHHLDRWDWSLRECVFAQKKFHPNLTLKCWYLLFIVYCQSSRDHAGTCLFALFGWSLPLQHEDANIGEACPERHHEHKMLLKSQSRSHESTKSLKVSDNKCTLVTKAQ